MVWYNQQTDGSWNGRPFCTNDLCSQGVPGMAQQTPFPLDVTSLPPDLIAAVAQEAADDADRVGQFLDVLSENPVFSWWIQRPRRLPASVLLELMYLGFALRLLIWEQCGLQVHRDAGLPPARDILRDVFLAPGDPAAAARIAQLPGQVMALFIQRFAWAGRRELGTAMVLDPADEEQALEALADFLWDHRYLDQAERRE
jgi:hypothetical protein